VQNRGLERQVLNEVRELDTRTVSVEPTVISSRLGPFASSWNADTPGLRGDFRPKRH